MTNEIFDICIFLDPYLSFKRLSSSINKLASTRAETVLLKRLMVLFGGGGILNLLLSKRVVFIGYYWLDSLLKLHIYYLILLDIWLVSDDLFSVKQVGIFS